MPDMTMCSGTGCPLKEQCYRAKKEPSTYQSYFDKPPFDGDNCEYFWVMKQEKKNP